jgi:hypothetical protein
MLGAIKVTESATDVSVDGIPADFIARDVRRIWSTEKINQWLFSRLTKNGFNFPKFFAPDVVYALETIGGAKRGWTKGSTISRLIEELVENTWLKNISAEHPAILDFSQLSRIKLPLLKHQRAFLEHYNKVVPAMDLTGYLLSARPGSGKTLIILALAACLKSDKVILVVPKNSVERVWVKTIRELLTHEETYWVAAEGKPYKNEKYLIFHYEALEQARSLAHTVAGAHNLLVGLDESHNFNESTAARTNAFIDICKTTNTQHVVWSSGTPLKAMGYEMIPILKTIAKYFTSDVEMRFRKIFGFKAGRAVDILRNRIGLVSFKVEKTDDAEIENKSSSTTIKVRIPNSEQYTLDAIRMEMSKYITERMTYYTSQMKRYEKLYATCLAVHEKTLTTSEEKQDFKTYKRDVAMIRQGYDPEAMKAQAAFCNAYELKKIIPSLRDKQERDDFRDVRAIIKYVKLKVMGEALGKILGRKRAQCHADMVKYVPWKDLIDQASKKTVVFTSFVEALKAMDIEWKHLGLKPLLVYGETNANVNGIIGHFEKDPDINPLGATYQSLSTAVPLVMANQAIFLNPPFRDHEMTQAKARIDRLGQDTPVHFVHILLDTGDAGNISTRSSDILAWSKEQVEAMTGGDGLSEGEDSTLTKYFNTASEESYHDPHNEFDISFETYFKDYCGE